MKWHIYHARDPWRYVCVCRPLMYYIMIERVDFSTPEYYANTAWNLNNLPKAYGSLLRHIDAHINGVNVPWLYFGMLFASFCWHAEDNYMYSVNYMHTGAKKHWYGIPASHCDSFEAVWRANVPERFKEKPDLFFHVCVIGFRSCSRRRRRGWYTSIFCIYIYILCVEICDTENRCVHCSSWPWYPHRSLHPITCKSFRWFKYDQRNSPFSIKNWSSSILHTRSILIYIYIYIYI